MKCSIPLNPSLEFRLEKENPYHLDLPVDVPLFHVAEAPGLNGVSGAGVYADQSVVGDAN